MRSRMTRVVVAVALGLALVPGLAAPAHAETVREAQWYLDALNIPEAHRISTGAGVIVAVIDSGVEADHPDLAGQVLPGTSFGVDAPNGWSSSAEAAHGTEMAGIIAAKGGGPSHALGIAPGAKILPVALPLGTRNSGQRHAEAIRWAVDHRAKVINMSFGGGVTPDAVELEAVRYALSKDVVLVAAAGNRGDGDAGVIVPARIPGVVAVSGTDRDARLWLESCTGPEVAISAPAVDVATTTSHGKYDNGYSSPTGTSPATAIVSGTVALIRAKYPNLNAANVINRLLATAKDQGTPGRDEQYGFGSVRVVDALTKDVAPVSANPVGEPPAPTPTATAEASAANHGGGSSAWIWIVLGVVAAGVLLLDSLRRRRRRA